MKKPVVYIFVVIPFIVNISDDSDSGFYKIKDDRLVLTADDEINVYVFLIKNDTLTYLADESTDINEYAYDKKISDGDAFIFYQGLWYDKK